jgi:hypothetical protein
VVADELPEEHRWLRDRHDDVARDDVARDYRCFRRSWALDRPAWFPEDWSGLPPELRRYVDLALRTSQ